MFSTKSVHLGGSGRVKCKKLNQKRLKLTYKWVIYEPQNFFRQNCCHFRILQVRKHRRKIYSQNYWPLKSVEKNIFTISFFFRRLRLFFCFLTPLDRCKKIFRNFSSVLTNQFMWWRTKSETLYIVFETRMHKCSAKTQ